ncbi:MAG: MFS transporter [Bacillota bacterium]|nr:MFS transporter [Bacillota bacterium]
MDIFKNRLFTKLFLATFGSQMGSTIGNMAFAFYLLDHFSKKPYYATIAELMYSFPTLLVFYLVGVLADRFDRKKIAVNSDWIRAVLTACLFIAISFHGLFSVFLILFARSAVSKFFAPAEMSILQGVLDKDQYMKASGLNQAVMGLFMLFGVGLGAISYHYLGITGSVVIDGVSFIFSAILIRSCQIPQEVRTPNGRTRMKEINFRNVLSDFKDGFKYIFHFKLLKSIIYGFLVFGLINGGFAVMPIFTMKYKLAPSNYEEYASFFSIFLGIGYIIGSSIGNKLIQQFKAYRVIIGGVLLSGILSFVLGTLLNVWIYFGFVFLMGIILAPVNIAISGWMNELVNPKFMGRVSGWIDPLMMAAHSFSLGVIAIIFPAFVSVESIYYVIGILLIGVGLYYFMILPKLAHENIQINIEKETTLSE